MIWILLALCSLGLVQLWRVPHCPAVPAESAESKDVPPLPDGWCGKTWAYCVPGGAGASNGATNQRRIQRS